MQRFLSKRAPRAAQLPVGASALFALCAFVAPSVHAQGPIDAGAPRTTVVQVTEAAPPGPDSYLPSAPPSVHEERKFNKHKVVVVPDGGPGLPLPKSSEVNPQGWTPGPQSAPGDFRYFLNRPVTPSGAGISASLVEPAGAINRDTVLYTGNTFAAPSKDSGVSWSHINPSTRFTAPDGPFCCDQRVLHVPSPNMTIWLLEYRYSASRGTGSLRIAYAKGRDDLRNNRFSSFVVNPRTFGFGNGFFLDYSDIAYGSRHLYGSAIVAPGGSTGSISYVLWRARLSDVHDGGNASIQYYTAATLGGYGNYRFGQGSTSTMYWAAHESTSRLRVYRWSETSGNAQICRRSVSAWNRTPTAAPGPDRRDWTGFRWTSNCVLGGYANAGEVGFLWTSGSVSGRPRNFVRVARFRTSDMSLIGQRDIWSSSVAYHFPYAATNSRGHIGVTIAFGGGTWHPSAGAFIVDDFTSWSGVNRIYTMRTGRSGPASNRWGDYFHCGRNSNRPATWVGMGFTKQGTVSGRAEPRYVWFGRERDQPTWVNLAVQSTPITGVPITVPERDRFDRGSGNTNLTRSYAQSQGYSLVAPSTRTSGATTYVFDRWSLRTAPTGRFIEQPVGQRGLTVSTIGSLADTAIARYVTRRTLNVRSRFATSVPMALSARDINGRQNGNTNLVRYYKNGAALTVTAPSVAGSRRFHHWRINGFRQPIGQRAIRVTMTATRTIEAWYGVQTIGTFRSFGASCRGTNGNPTQRASGSPTIANAPRYWLSAGPRTSAALLNIGFSTRVWNTLPLPLTLPGTSCRFYNDQAIPLGIATSSTGAASIPIALPNDTSLIGARYYTQWMCVDPRANTWKLTLSNSYETRVGGWEFK